MAAGAIIALRLTKGKLLAPGFPAFQIGRFIRASRHSGQKSRATLPKETDQASAKARSGQQEAQRSGTTKRIACAEHRSLPRMKQE